MELIEGESVEARVRRAGPLPVPVALEIAVQVAHALIAAEAQRLVHRDLKPANLMLAKGPELTVKVIDFGLAKATVDAACEADLTHGGFVGTPTFASPEQWYAFEQTHLTGRGEVVADWGPWKSIQNRRVGVDARAKK